MHSGIEEVIAIDDTEHDTDVVNVIFIFGKSAEVCIAVAVEAVGQQAEIVAPFAVIGYDTIEEVAHFAEVVCGAITFIIFVSETIAELQKGRFEDGFAIRELCAVIPAFSGGDIISVGLIGGVVALRVFYFI